MKRFAISCCVGLVVLVVGTNAARSGDDKKPVNLLRLPAAKLESSGVPAGSPVQLDALTDGNPSTVARLPVQGESVDVVYGFGAGMVAPERLVVHVPRDVPADARADRVELLVSMVSASAGFWSLRSDPLNSTADAQVFSFPPTGARWIMVRFTPAPKSKFVTIAEVAVMGRAGAPVSRYAFNEAPAKAFDVLERLKKSSSLNVTILPDEAALFADVKEGKFTRWSFAEAAILASGVVDADKRRDYLKRLDILEAEARKASADAKTPFDKGEKLLTWLHGKEGPLAKGYVAHQTDLSVILDTSKYNCVSSATIYNVLGRRLGLDLRAIEVPDHAFSILYDGTKHADVETTTDSGFDPARDSAAQEQLLKKTGFRYIPDQHRDQRREIGEAGLVAIIYYNHGVRLRDEKRYHEALLANFRAMSLDREFHSAVKNALACLGDWSRELARQGKFEEAINVLDTGVALAPKDAMLLHNRKVTWGEWAEASAKTGKDDEAIAILRSAQKQTSDDQFSSMQAWIFLRRGEELVNADAWEKALAIVEPALRKIDKAPQEELRRWQAELPLRRASALMRKDDYAKAVAVLQAGRERQPKDDRLANNLVYTVQEWARATQTKDGEDKTRALLLEQIKRFPELAGLKSVAATHVQRVVRKFQDDGKYEEALAAVERNRELFPNDAETKSMSVAVFDAWARKLAQDKQWSKAVEVYEKALQRVPADGLLKTNLIYTMQEWGRDVHKTAGQEKAKVVFLDLRKRFPNLAEVDQLARTHVQRVVAELGDQGKYTDGLAAIASNKDLLKNSDDAKSLAYSVYDRWAQSFTAKKDWQGAADLYAKALASYPKDGHFTNNAVAVWDSWARTFFPAKDWPQAIVVYEKSLERFPDNGTLKNNLNYCKEQMKNK